MQIYRVALKKTPTDIHPHKMARNCLNVGIIGPRTSNFLVILTQPLRRRLALYNQEYNQVFLIKTLYEKIEAQIA